MSLISPPTPLSGSGEDEVEDGKTEETEMGMVDVLV
jgi:hypothetical protein